MSIGPSTKDAADMQAADRPRVGRPRKWASEAERKRAYRERLAVDLEDAIGLRKNLHSERRRAAGLKQQNDRLRRRLVVTERRADEAEENTRLAQDRMTTLKEAADRDRQLLFEARAALAEIQATIREQFTASGTGGGAAISNLVGLSRAGRRRRLRTNGAPVRVCDVEGCSSPAECRVQGPRGVERDLCEDHGRPGGGSNRWRVLRRY
jgi:hypothetical protein